MNDTPIIVDLKLAPDGYDTVESGKTQKGDLLGNPAMWHIKDTQIRWIPVGTSIGDDVVKLFKDLSLLVARPTVTIEDDKGEAAIVELVKNLTLKEKVFINIIHKLTENGYDQVWLIDGELSKTVAQKLLFFVCLASNEGGNATDSLFNIFDNFHVTPFGHLENDISIFINKNYSSLSKDLLSHNDYESTVVTSSIEFLNKEFSFFKKISYIELIEVSHMYLSWRNVYAEALRQNKRVGKINTTVLLNERLRFNEIPN
jgi:hypothetical protein